ncbi:hypothetical protein PBY51_002003 [Eleginops maclovinus]|uniref:Uncharacterized protein n=1 Tax=Eleginops maclovinus TaxID=56733 RepID=A0AAN8A7G8_ELEMC|nr:hypothetical protein PBY51_002003 [Eleginops maclovinus]
MSLISHAHIALEKRRMLLQCRGVKLRASGMGGKDAEREMETISRLLPPASLSQASVPQQLSDQRRIKVRRDRQAATGEHLSGRPIFRHDAAH